MKWSDADEAELLRLWNDGLSAGVIEKRLKNRTRSAILGKLDRLGVLKDSGHQTVSTVAPPLRKSTKFKEEPKPRRPRDQFGNKMSGLGEDKKPLSSPAWSPLPGSVPVGLMERTGCCFIVSRDSPFLYCDRPTEKGVSYCTHHIQVMKPKPQDKGRHFPPHKMSHIRIAPTKGIQG